MYALIENNQIVKTVSNVRSLFPNVSIPASGLPTSFLADNNVMSIVDGERADERFYWVTPAQPPVQMVNGIPTRLYVSTPKALEDVTETPEGSEESVTTKGLKSQWIEQIKDAANKELAATDWYVIRKAERDVEIPQEVVDARAKIVADCTAKEAAIAAATTIDELKEALFPTAVGDASGSE